MIKGPTDAALMARFYVSWKGATACVLTRAVRYWGHLLLITLPLVKAIRGLTSSALCPGSPEMAARLIATLNPVEQFHRLATPSFLGSAEHPRGVVRCSRDLEGSSKLELGWATRTSPS